MKKYFFFPILECCFPPDLFLLLEGLDIVDGFYFIVVLYKIAIFLHFVSRKYKQGSSW